ncbi:MAG: helix-turn-helix transcriptional regulator, partial [Mycobacteriales bacterium]
MRSDRLLAILLMLRSRGTVPAPELAGELEVSTRTIYRDMAALSTAGVPVYAERGRAGGCGLLPGYRTDVSGLTAEETRALFAVTGRGMLADLGLEPALRGAMRKLTASLPADQRGDAARVSARVVVDPRRWRAANEQLPHLAAIQQAVWTDRRLRMRYGGSGRASVSTYTVDPYGLITKAGVWYLLAAHRGAPRLYRVARVSGVTILPRRSSRPDGLDLEALWQQLRARVERPSTAAVEVRFRVRAARTDMV